MRSLNYPEFDLPEKKRGNINNYRDILRDISSGSCVYCTLMEVESIGSTFNIDHFRPKKLFPQYEFEYRNLRYSCPRCNSYKQQFWISIEYGCQRNCETCTIHACKKNIYRLIDCIEEDPEEHICLNGEGVLEMINDSMPGDFTIKRLRLNSQQLIRLRRNRKIVEDWRKTLNDDLKHALDEKESWIRHKENVPDNRNIDIVINYIRQMICNMESSLGYLEIFFPFKFE